MIGNSSEVGINAFLDGTGEKLDTVEIDRPVPYCAGDLEALLCARVVERQLDFAADWQICYSEQIHAAAAHLYTESVNTAAAAGYLDGPIEPISFPAAPFTFGGERQSSGHSDRVTIAQLLKGSNVTGVQRRQVGQTYRASITRIPIAAW